MGRRANLAIRRGGNIELFYSSQHGAMLPGPMFFGAEAAERLIRAQTSDERWLDETTAEGGAVLDHDTHTLAWFNDDVDNPFVYETLIPLMQHYWPGWSLRWATRGQRDLVRVLGIDEALVTTPLHLPAPLEPSDLENEWPSRRLSSGIAVVARDHGGARCLPGHMSTPLLLAGPALAAEILEECPDVETTRARVLALDPVDHGAFHRQTSLETFISLSDRRVLLRGDPAHRRASELTAAVGDRWSGWHVETVGPSVQDFCAVAGCDVPDYLLPLPDPTPLSVRLQVIAELTLQMDPLKPYVKHLGRELVRDPAGAVAEVIRQQLGDLAASQWNAASATL